jgi:hypothetical protein
MSCQMIVGQLGMTRRRGCKRKIRDKAIHCFHIDVDQILSDQRPVFDEPSVPVAAPYSDSRVDDNVSRSCCRIESSCRIDTVDE